MLSCVHISHGIARSLNRVLRVSAGRTDDDDDDDEGRINFSMALSPKTTRTRNNKS